MNAVIKPQPKGRLQAEARGGFQGRQNPRFCFSVPSTFLCVGGIYAQVAVAFSSVLTRSHQCPPAGHRPGVITSTSAVVLNSVLLKLQPPRLVLDLQPSFDGIMIIKPTEAVTHLCN